MLARKEMEKARKGKKKKKKKKWFYSNYFNLDFYIKI
jgi:hypothetical protein